MGYSHNTHKISFTYPCDEIPNTVNQFNLAAIKVSVLKAVNIRH